MTVELVDRQQASIDIEAKRLMNIYRRRTPRSALLHDRARKVLPGGDTRTVAYHPPYPLTIKRGAGCELIDADGNEYIDLLNNYTSLIHGHAHPAINAAVIEQIGKGTNFAAALESQTRLAEILTSRVDSVDKIRFTNSGTEATMNAVRVARAFTGRERLVKMEGGYHGTYDDFEISVHPPIESGTDNAPVGTIDAPGVPRNRLDLVDVIPFNDVPAAQRIFDANGSDIAAVIVEPVMGSGVIPADGEFLEALRSLTLANGALLIFDEVMTFRLEFGGIQAHYGVKPDLSTFAKIICGGYPGGAFGGSESIMALFDPAAVKPLWQSGTFNGNAITTTAGAVALDLFDAGEVARVNDLGERFRQNTAASFARRRVPATVIGAGSMAGIHFVDGPVRNYRDAARGNQGAKRLLHLALLNEGVFCAPRLLFCMSTPMTTEVIDEVDNRFNRALDALDGLF